ncbi:hypothetical protein FCE95_08675 [Luteimonas gilva]|uniref:Peptidase inhibitor I78 family protein n=1 Tax=Luteimonas gilva TaxID=2572684 RepID=A0A4U5JN56_9GAMM|nr:I78 family peptidase inhibitor [Luteimonas gilva]TKR30206.1 hypothetical protein FCE95_08675 [Luteimonas gilva]
MSRTALSFAVLLPLALSACSSSPSSDAAASAPPAADAPKQCDAAAAQWAVGKAADQALVDKAVADSHSSNARVIKPGQAVTMDYRQDRLNIEVDAANNVVAVRCG